MDYANALAESMEPPVRVLQFDRSQPPSVEGDVVLLHYSGYGYARYGAPMHLLAWVKRNKPGMKRFSVFFHELYAQSRSPLSSVFWATPVQRHVAAQLARASDSWITALERSVAWLHDHDTPGKPCLHLQVPSNIGELSEMSSDGRKAALVVFGTELVRATAWRAGGERMLQWARDSGIALHDIGSPIRDASLAATLKAHGAVCHGRLESPAIQAIMRSSSYGVTSYPRDFVGKSGVFAAYCANGLAPVLLSGNQGSFEKLVAGEHYFDGIPATNPSPREADRVARAAFDWYQGHRVATHVEKISNLLRA